MDCVSPILSIARDLFDCTAKCTSHIRDLRENIECLREEMEILRLRSDDVKARLEFAKQQQMIPKREVESWLQEVGEEKNEVDAILEEGNGLLQKKCLGRCCNLRLTNDIGKRVNGKISRVTKLTSRGGEFEDVAYRSPHAVVEELPMGRTVGLDSLCSGVLSSLVNKAKVVEGIQGIIGIYGKPGIGKTTLMKKINNGLLEISHHFDLVIWVSLMPKQASTVEAVQQVIRNKLQIPDSMWLGRTEEERAGQIFSILTRKRFLLLLDDVWQRFDLLEIGVPSAKRVQNHNLN